MDIKHTPDAVAALTLGKDMTLRDAAQGAYRMRGIGQGQTIKYIVTPEVNPWHHRASIKTFLPQATEHRHIRTYVPFGCSPITFNR
jgi:hypothetical protein